MGVELSTERLPNPGIIHVSSNSKWSFLRAMEAWSHKALPRSGRYTEREREREKYFVAGNYCAIPFTRVG